MENNTAVTPEQAQLDVAAVEAVQTLHMAVSAAFTSASEAMLEISKNQSAMADSINQMIRDRAEQVALIGRLMTQIEALAKLQDSDHARLEVLMALSGAMKSKNVN